MSFKRISLILAVLSLIPAAVAIAHDQTSQVVVTEKDSLMSQSISVFNLPQNDTNYVSVIKPPLRAALWNIKGSNQSGRLPVPSLWFMITTNEIFRHC